ncbi:hypothetical protein VPH35_094280 [Triticum aestivum]
MASTLHPAARRSRPAPGPPIVATANDGVLPLDLLQDILLRLPAKSICRFRAVCISWHSLLCHPDFIAAAQAQPGPSIAVGVCHDGPSSIVLSVLNMESGHVLKQVSIDTTSHHGTPPPHGTPGVSPERAVCVVGKDGQLRLINPNTGAVKLLPFPPSTDHLSTSCTLGRAALTGEYKVLAITNSTNHVRQICKILTLDDNGVERRWRETGSPRFNVVLPLPPWTYNREVALVDGLAYFLVSPYHYNIMAFDLQNEVWQPDALRGPARENNVTLVTLQGQLVACHENYQTYELWFLVDPQQALWSMRQRILMPYPKLQSPMATSHEYFIKPLAVRDDRKIVVWMRVAPPGFSNTLDAVMRYYDPRTWACTDEMHVTKCNDVTVHSWSILHLGRGRGRAALES